MKKHKINKTQYDENHDHNHDTIVISIVIVSSSITDCIVVMHLNDYAYAYYCHY